MPNVVIKKSVTSVKLVNLIQDEWQKQIAEIIATFDPSVIITSDLAAACCHEQRPMIKHIITSFVTVSWPGYYML